MSLPQPPPFPSRDVEETRLSGWGGLVRILTLTVLASGAAGLGPAPRASAEGGRKPTVLLEDDSAERIERIERNLSAARRYIEDLQRQLDEIRYGGPVPSRPAIARGEDLQARVRPVATAAPPQRAPVDESKERVSEDQEAPVLQSAALRQAQAVLIGAGRLEVEPGLAFSYTDRNRLDVRGLDVVHNVFIGNITVRNVLRSSFSPFMSFRYGLTDRVQLSMNVPYVYSNDRVVIPPGVQQSGGNLAEDVETTSSANDIGDITLGASYHALLERPWVPDVILSSTLKTDSGASPFEVTGNTSASGTGFWGLTVGATAVKVSDPAVLFANADYFFHFAENNVSVYDSVDPPDSYGMGLGFSYSLNPFLRFTSRVSGRRIEKTKLNGQEIDGSDQVTGSFSMGVSYGLGYGRAFDLTAGIGLTDDSPDFVLSLSMPFNFYVGSPDWLTRQWRWW